MASQEPLHAGVVVTGGHDDTSPPSTHDRRDGADIAVQPRGAVVSIVAQGSAAVENTEGAAADPWPGWARPQLEHAVSVASTVPRGGSVAGVLYRDWFNPAVAGIDLLRVRRPLAGIYRAAHAGSRIKVSEGGVSVLARHDIIGVDGWWRTWGDRWTPPRTRPGSVRLLLTPRADRLADFVATLTQALTSTELAWSLGVATRPRRLLRYGCAVLDLPSADAIPDGLLDDLAPTLRHVTPPLCLPLAPGVALAHYPDNGMTFGEHRCHLIALALRRSPGATPHLDAIARVFAAHGIDPAHPYRAG